MCMLHLSTPPCQIPGSTIVPSMEKSCLKQSSACVTEGEVNMNNIKSYVKRFVYI